MRTLLMGMTMLGMVVAGCDDPATAQSTGDPTADATVAAESWLARVDEGDYGGSWDEACEYFRGAVAKDQWERQIRGARGPLGALESRTLMSAEYATQLPGAPDGEYVVIQYRTSFENKASAVETITPMLEPDGAWRVSGYFIR